VIEVEFTVCGMRSLCIFTVKKINIFIFIADKIRVNIFLLASF